MEKNWYVLKVKPKSEKKVAQQLTQLGIENYLPLQLKLRRWRDRKKYVYMVLIHGYVFVYLKENERKKVFDVYGVVQYLAFSGKIVIVKPSEIEQLKLFCTFANVSIDEKFEAGDYVEVIEGPLMGLRGQLIDITNGKKLKILIPSLGCFANIIMDKFYVKKISNMERKY